ncbi:MAG: arylsulfatase A [Planctomycetota bacterium]|jgi:arylsulfatase A
MLQKSGHGNEYESSEARSANRGNFLAGPSPWPVGNSIRTSGLDAQKDHAHGRALPLESPCSPPECPAYPSPPVVAWTLCSCLHSNGEARSTKPPSSMVIRALVRRVWRMRQSPNAAIVLMISAVALHLGSQLSASDEPNIVLIYADDLGYGDVSCYNPERGKIPTPHIDRLATEGMRFTDAHSSSGVCSPSRYTVMTGRYHWRTRLQKGIVGLWERPLIAEDRLTVAGMLRQEGYRTACVGKWHLGWDWPIDAEQRPHMKGKKDATASAAQRATWQEVFSHPIAGGPIARGFDEYFGTDVPNWPPYCFIDQDRTVGLPSEFLPADLFKNHQASVQGPALPGWQLEPILPALGERAVEFISRASKRDEPYFLYMPLTAPHTPLSPNEAWKGKSGINTYADLVMETDAIVGQVLSAIEASGEAQNTLVIFTSDNGCAPYIGAPAMEKQGHFASGPLRGYKSDVWEGGHRVAFIVRYPGVVEPGTINAGLVQQADIMATCAEIAGHELAEDEGEDSYSILPLLAGAREALRPNAINQSMGGLFAVRRGPWKLIFGKGSGGWTKGEDEQEAQLYNLSEDLGETRNLYAAHADVAGELTLLMTALVKNGRSTPGAPQQNDVPVNWQRFMGKNK